MVGGIIPASGERLIRAGGAACCRCGREAARSAAGWLPCPSRCWRPGCSRRQCGGDTEPAGAGLSSSWTEDRWN